MTLPLFVLAAVCAVNAPRCRTAVPSGALPRARVAALGAGLTLATLAVLAVLADPLLDLVGLSAATARLAAGLLLLVTGLLNFSWPAPAPEPAMPGWRAAVVPVAFPTLLMPGLALLTVCASADHDAVVAVAGTGLALATLPASVALGVGTPVRERVLDGTALVLSGLLMLAAFGLLMDGVFDI